MRLATIIYELQPHDDGRTPLQGSCETGAGQTFREVEVAIVASMLASEVGVGAQRKPPGAGMLRVGMFLWRRVQSPKVRRSHGRGRGQDPGLRTFRMPRRMACETEVRRDAGTGSPNTISSGLPALES